MPLPLFFRAPNHASQICSSSVLHYSSDPFFLCSFRSFLVCSSPKLSLRESVLLFRTRVYKTGDLCGIILPWVLDWNRVFKTRDASLQKIFKHLLTYDIVSPHYARLQISPIFLCLIAILKILFIWPFFLCYQILKSTIWYQNQWFFFFLILIILAHWVSKLVIGLFCKFWKIK